MVTTEYVSWKVNPRGVGEHTILIVPSHEEDAKVSLATRFQNTEKTSRLCSCHDWTGNCGTEMSKSLTEPSPHPTATWFSCASDQAVSKRESCVSYLCVLSV